MTKNAFLCFISAATYIVWLTLVYKVLKLVLGGKRQAEFIALGNTELTQFLYHIKVLCFIDMS